MQWSLISLTWVHTSRSLKLPATYLFRSKLRKNEFIPVCALFNLQVPTREPTQSPSFPLGHRRWLTCCRERCLTSASFKENGMHFALGQRYLNVLVACRKKNKKKTESTISNEPVPFMLFSLLLSPPSLSSPSHTTPGKKKINTA